VLYSFASGSDGVLPKGQLTLDSAGDLYGTTLYGGKHQKGVVFELMPSSGGKWTENILYNFTGDADGGEPPAGVILDTAGNLYGTTALGGHLLKCSSESWPRFQGILGLVERVRRGGPWLTEGDGLDRRANQ
jgi:uncharacterized repeat protein (TIGR03803 family)